ncbi:MBL fold metallo-hydrolase [Saccharibacillus sp. JS10]|uniref:MBL fold metallo-hydrolase n=1 Tax=Saccharibacillus sp. JS10 TaxID=2950552 RepID=UPI00210C2E17|nr:MBL fold metallo-hydrolase [Saccharibacillus sp. JS10]MCQ4088735.1 MBL fold metallo-hydrolase [Saccharibacillus sp. JS10]
MLRVETFSLGPAQTNAYLLRGEDDLKAVVIDPGMNPAALMRRVEHLHIEAILLTHAHFDHMAGVDELRKAKGCPVYLHDLESEWLSNGKYNGSARWPDLNGPITAEPADFALSQGQKLNLIGNEFTVLHTPGHSPGSVSFLCGKDLFAGDVLFRDGVGRTDLYGSRQGDLVDSIRLKLYTLPDDTVVYPGHGPRTKIGYEKANNPFVPAL